VVEKVELILILKENQIMKWRFKSFMTELSRHIGANTDVPGISVLEEEKLDLCLVNIKD
jgi:hypothetical protein